jgi:GDPmannose 4,6-dehydratase
MWGMFRADQPDTFVMATNRSETARDIVSMSGREAGFNLNWKDEAEVETGVDSNSDKVLVCENPK